MFFKVLPCSVGSAELAAVGVSGAVFNLVSKLFNVPLLNITTSFVAEEQASVISADDSSGNARGICFNQKNVYILRSCILFLLYFSGLIFCRLWDFRMIPLQYYLAEKEKIFLPSVSSVIVLAAALGIIETVALSTGSSFLMSTMGIPVVCLV